MSLPPRTWIVALFTLVVGGCAALDPVARNGGRPERIVLHYDFAGEWAATAGDSCVQRVGLSDSIFVAVASDPNGAAGRFYVEQFFMLEPGERAQALISAMHTDGRLTLTVETETMAGGRNVPVTYRLHLEALDTEHIRLVGFHAAVQTQGGESSTDLLREAATGTSIPVLSNAGTRGLCLKRL